MNNELNPWFEQQVDAFMAQRSWHRKMCAGCGRAYFSKDADAPTCERGACSSGRRFLDLSKRKRPIAPKEVESRLARHFTSLRYEHVAAMNIANALGTTDLVIAGVQMFDGAIHRGKKPKEGSIFISQPSVRMQFQGMVGSQDGVSTAFVNVCTEKADDSFEGYLSAVDHWLSALSALGLHMKDISIVARNRDCDWGTGSYTARELFFMYGGLELGDAAYRVVPTRQGMPLAISDIGFGLERIAWALNKTPHYFDLLKPGEVAFVQGLIDACRTSALLAIEGVQPSNKGPGLQLRRLAKTMSEGGMGSQWSQLFDHYLHYWSSFTGEAASKEEALRTMRLEVDRFRNLRIASKGKLPPPLNETTEEYFKRLVYTLGADPHAVRLLIEETCSR